MADFVTCESTEATLPQGTQDDAQVEVERLSDQEVHEEVSEHVLSVSRQCQEVNKSKRTF